MPDISVDVVFDGTYSDSAALPMTQIQRLNGFTSRRFLPLLKQNGEFLLYARLYRWATTLQLFCPPYIQRYQAVFGDQREMIFDSEFSEPALAIEPIDTPQATLTAPLKHCSENIV